MGAALAALVSAERPEVRQLVMWDPIVSGRDYLDGPPAFWDGFE